MTWTWKNPDFPLIMRESRRSWIWRFPDLLNVPDRTGILFITSVSLQLFQVFYCQFFKAFKPDTNSAALQTHQQSYHSVSLLLGGCYHGDFCQLWQGRHCVHALHLVQHYHQLWWCWNMINTSLKFKKMHIIAITRSTLWQIGCMGLHWTLQLTK